jgi:hypothetical protein
MAGYRTGKDSLTARRKGKMPKANIDWARLPMKVCVEDRTTYYVARVPGKPPAVVFWGGADARAAQSDLARRAQTGVYCKRRK